MTTIPSLYPTLDPEDVTSQAIDLLNDGSQQFWISQSQIVKGGGVYHGLVGAFLKE